MSGKNATHSHKRVTDRHHPLQLRWELRMRFVAAFLWVLGFSALEHHVVIIIGNMLAVATLRVLGIPLKRILKRIVIVAPFLLVSFFTLLISDGFPITGESFSFASLIALRIVACVFVVTLISVDDIKSYLNSLAAVHLPDALISTLFLTQRYVHLIGQQLVAVKDALVSRLFTPRLRLKTFQVYGQITGGMTIKAIDRSQHVQQAMESRGFQGRVWTDMAEPIHTGDVVKTAVSVLVMAGLIVVDGGGVL